MDHHVLASYAVDCDFHAHIKRDMVHNMANFITEKVEFRSEENFYKNCISIYSEVYVFSPADMCALGAAIEAELQTTKLQTTKILCLEAEVKRLREEIKSHYAQEKFLGVTISQQAKRIAELADDKNTLLSTISMKQEKRTIFEKYILQEKK
jgi:hypothetical protein